jgi:drug/metabolite transporter (DMT)-like permease
VALIGLHVSRSDVAILASAFLWGTFWIPLREINLAGLGGAPANTASFLLGLAVVLPLVLPRLRRILTGGWVLWLAGFLMAFSIAIYAEGLIRGHVARVMLLFYLTPVWSTLISRVMLGEAITNRRIATIVLGLAGMLVVLGVDAGVPVPRTLAEWMGLVSGITWGFAMAWVNRTASRPILDRVFVQFVFLAPLFYLFTLIPGGRDSAPAQIGAMAGAAVWLVALAVVWVLPIVWLTVFAASRIDPGRLAIFLMFDIVVGLTTAALLTDEPFGSRELIGAALIGAAGLTEIVGKRRPVPPSV